MSTPTNKRRASSVEPITPISSAAKRHKPCSASHDEATITATFIGNRPVVGAVDLFAARPAEPGDKHDAVPENEQQLKQRFATYLGKRLNRKPPSKPTIKGAENWKKWNKSVLSLRALALDPDSVMEHLNIKEMTDWLAKGDEFDLESFFEVRVMQLLLAQIMYLEDTWGYRGPGEVRTRDKKKKGADTERIVKGWHNNRCVLTGADKVTHPANIVETRHFLDLPIRRWSLVQMFWPLETLRSMDLDEARNILPLNAVSFAMWEENIFGLLPIKNDTDSDHDNGNKILVQVVAFRRLFEGVSHSLPGTEPDDYLQTVDFRSKPVRQIQHGDVYQLSTTTSTSSGDDDDNPAAGVKRPLLPDFRYLQLRYLQQKILATQKMGVLDNFFRGPPPKLVFHAGHDFSEVCIPDEWVEELDYAVERGVLDQSARRRWERSVQEYEYQKENDMWEEEEDSEEEEEEDGEKEEEDDE